GGALLPPLPRAPDAAHLSQGSDPSAPGWGAGPADAQAESPRGDHRHQLESPPRAREPGAGALAPPRARAAAGAEARGHGEARGACPRGAAAAAGGEE